LEVGEFFNPRIYKKKIDEKDLGVEPSFE